ncbi:hypothetical protein Q3G72_032272 [Acer saccharum]|nr:hypothetical protein Q3G72_032272 [Acer saccharum]
MDKLSFAEVVPRKKWDTEERRKKERGNWIRLIVNRNSSDLRWLNRSVIGGKLVLWSFESEYESEGFIRNYFFWNDTFIRMEKWSENTKKQRKPSWVNIIGLPLRLWNINFFQLIGNLLGELFFIEDDTLLRKRFDRAKLLIVVLGDRLCPKKIKIQDGTHSFLASIEDNTVPVNFKWVGELLDLNFESDSNELDESRVKRGVVESSQYQSIRSDRQVLSHPLKDPIQLPLNGLEGDQIVGKDLEPLHLEVELVTDVSRIAEPNKTTEKGNRFMKDIIVKSRQQSNKSYWNLEEEIAKVIEKGVSLGYVFKSNEKDRDKEHIVMQEDHYNSRSNQGESQENSWNFDNEVAKVIEVGVALGFDFNGNEVEIGEKIANREKEDKALMATANDL